MHNRKHAVFICTGRIIAWLYVWWLNSVIYYSLAHWLLILNKEITLKYIVAKITSYVQSCLKCFIVNLLSYCWQEKVAQLLLYSVRLLNGSHPLLGRQYTPLIKAPKPAPSIPCCNTQVNTIKQLLYYQETLYCVGTHYYVMQEA